jgi:hypothetical protein
MVTVRRDIAFVVRDLSRHSLPTTNYWQALTGLVRYLKGTADQGVVYGFSSGHCLLLHQHMEVSRSRKLAW